ncbi:MAG: efflux RND transporter periplasmic adaptor subunit [Firmicutes bacterium]|nr:efflux RND transporter periplasmic adaptor subunit [Bacillota bacterium]
MAKKKRVLTKKQKILRRVIRILVILAAAILAFLIWWKYFHTENTAVMDAYSPVYDTAAVTNIEETYAATGKIAAGRESGSGDSAQVQTSASSSGSTAGTSSSTTTGTTSAGTDSYPVKEVYVKVGDQVKKGDPLYSLDMSELEDQIALDQKKLALQQQSDAIDDAAAQRALTQAQEASAQQYEDATRKLNEASADANETIVDSVTGNQDIARLQQVVSDAQAAYDSAKKTYDALVSQQTQVTSQYNALSGEISLDNANLQAKYSTPESQLTDDYQNAVKSIDEKQVTLQQYANAKTAIDTQVSDAQTKLDDAKTALDSAKSDLTTATGNLTTSDDSIKTQQRALEDQASSVKSTNRSTAEAEAAAKDTIAKNAISQESSALDTQHEIQKAQEKLNGAVIRAAMDGTVTSVSAQPGQMPGTDAVVINDLETMKVVIEVEEGHIADIQTGQRVSVKTDSTGNEVLSGKVTYTAITPTTATPTASGSSSQNTAVSTGTKATYRVEVTLDSPNDRLRIGMTANVTFILASASDVLAVPTAAIQTDENGNSYVLVADQTAQAGTEADTSEEEAAPATFGERVTNFLNRITRKESAQEGSTDMTSYPTQMVPVTTGISDDYYTEITSGDVKEGDLVEEPGGSTSGTSDLLEGLYAAG